MKAEPCQCGWQALRGDPLPWLLEPGQPNLRWRVLVELVGRPPDSPAVAQARQGANAVEPLASLLEDLQADGTWWGRRRPWSRYAGPGWRVVAAAQWGADPGDPRLHAAVERLLEMTPGEGGFAAAKGAPASTTLTGRLVQAACDLGWGRHLRVVEGLAWLEEQEIQDAETAVATLAALAAAGERGPVRLRNRMVELLLDHLQRLQETHGRGRTRFGHPNLLGTDLCEVLWALVRAGVPYDPRSYEALQALQSASDHCGRWQLGREVPKSLPVAAEARPCIDAPSGWVSLHAATALLAWAVPAGLERRFPDPTE